jgi:hypothetical protein
MFDIVAEDRLQALRTGLQTLAGTTHVHVQRTSASRGAIHSFAFRVTIQKDDEALKQSLLYFLQAFMQNSEYFRVPAEVIGH